MSLSILVIISIKIIITPIFLFMLYFHLLTSVKQLGCQHMCPCGHLCGKDD